jgi:hypothetical protein
MPQRIELLKLLVDAEVAQILKQRLGAEGVADLVMEIINPHRQLTTAEKAKLAGVTPRAVKDRQKRAGA